MPTGQCDLPHLCVVSSVVLIKFKITHLVLTFKQFRLNTKLPFLRFMRDKQGKKMHRYTKINFYNVMDSNFYLIKKKSKSTQRTRF